MRFNRHELPIHNRYLIRRLSGHLVARSRSAFLTGRFLSTYRNLSLSFVPGSLTRPLMTIQGRVSFAELPHTFLPIKRALLCACQYSLPGVRDPDRASVLCFVFLENGRLVPFIVAFVRPLPRGSDRRRPGGSQRWSANPGSSPERSEKGRLFFSLSVSLFLSLVLSLSFVKSNLDICTRFLRFVTGNVSWS